MNKVIAVIAVLLIFTGCLKKQVVSTTGDTIATVRKISVNLNSLNWQERLKAVKEIGAHISIDKYGKSVGDAEILNLMIKSTFDSHEAVVIEAIKALSLLKYPESTGRLYELSMTGKNNNIRWYAIRSLSEHKSAGSIPAFRSGLKSEDWLIREASIKGLLMIDMVTTDEYIPLIVAAINDENDSVRIAALSNLNIKDDKIYNLASQILLNPKNESKHHLLKASLLALNGYAFDMKTREKLIDLLTHQNSELRILSLRALKTDNDLRKIRSDDKAGFDKIFKK